MCVCVCVCVRMCIYIYVYACVGSNLFPASEGLEEYKAVILEYMHQVEQLAQDVLKVCVYVCVCVCVMYALAG